MQLGSQRLRGYLASFRSELLVGIADMILPEILTTLLSISVGQKVDRGTALYQATNSVQVPESAQGRWTIDGNEMPRRPYGGDIFSPASDFCVGIRLEETCIKLAKPD